MRGVNRVSQLLDVLVLGCVWAHHGFNVIAGLIAAKPGLKRLRRLGAEGFRSYQM